MRGENRMGQKKEQPRFSGAAQELCTTLTTLLGHQ
jgi:hypothetical protein